MSDTPLTPWTKWISPLHGISDNNYSMTCCGCGAIHELQFRIQRRSVHGTVKRCVIFRARRMK